MKLKLIPLLMVIPLTACSQSSPIESKTFSFDTVTISKLYEGEQTNLTEIEKIITRYDKLSDNYESRGINNVYTINNTNEEVTIDSELYTLLKTSFDVANEGANYFNPLCGSLAKKWKNSLKNQQILGEITINDEAVTIFYKDKVVLVTGGGGSIGSELCRQIAKMNPKQLVILDIYENCAYEIQQELKFEYKVFKIAFI